MINSFENGTNRNLIQHWIQKVFYFWSLHFKAIISPYSFYQNIKTPVIKNYVWCFGGTLRKIHEIDCNKYWIAIKCLWLNKNNILLVDVKLIPSHIKSRIVPIKCGSQIPTSSLSGCQLLLAFLRHLLQAGFIFPISFYTCRLFWRHFKVTSHFVTLIFCCLLWRIHWCICLKNINDFCSFESLFWC